MPNNNPTGKNQYSDGKGRSGSAQQAGRDARHAPSHSASENTGTQTQDGSSDRQRDGSQDRGRR